MTLQAMTETVETIRGVHATDPSILAPLESFFGVDLNERLNDTQRLRDLCYNTY